MKNKIDLTFVTYFVLMLLFINNIADASTAQFKHKLKILKQEESFLGCFGTNCIPGCAHNFFIMENSSISFPCKDVERVSKFKEGVIYVFQMDKDYFICPSNTFQKVECLKCQECNSKVEQMKKLDQ